MGQWERREGCARAVVRGSQAEPGLFPVTHPNDLLACQQQSGAINKVLFGAPTRVQGGMVGVEQQAACEGGERTWGQVEFRVAPVQGWNKSTPALVTHSNAPSPRSASTGSIFFAMGESIFEGVVKRGFFAGGWGFQSRPVGPSGSRPADPSGSGGSSTLTTCKLQVTSTSPIPFTSVL